MPPLAAVGSFTAPLALGNQSVNCGFQPKAILFLCTLQTATGWGAAPAEAFHFIGGACSDNSAINNGTIARNNVGTSRDDGPAGAGARCIAIYRTSAPLVDCQADFVGFTATGFTINWTVASSAAWTIYYYALGGSDVERSRCAAFSLGTTPADQSTSNPGFRPDLVMMVEGSPFWSMGIAGGPDASQQASMHGVEVSGETPSSNAQSWDEGNLGGTYRTTGAAHPFTIEQDSLFSLTQFTALGFAINASDLPAASRAFAYYAIKGGSHFVGVGNAPTATGNQSFALPFTPVGVFCFSGLGIDGGTSSDVGVAMGFSDGANHSLVVYGDEDAAAPTVTNHYNDATNVIATAITLGTPSIDSLASLASLDTNGFTLNWSAVTGNQEPFLYWAFGPASNLHLLPILGVGA